MVKISELPKEKQELVEKLSKIQILGPCSAPKESINKIIEVAKKVRVEVKIE